MSVGDNISESLPPNPFEVENFEFNGWYTNADLTQPLSENATFSGNITLYAKFTRTCADLTFIPYSNDGADTGNTYTIDDYPVNMPINCSELGGIMGTDLRHAYMITEDGGYDEYEPVTSITVTEDMTVYVCSVPDDKCCVLMIDQMNIGLNLDIVLMALNSGTVIDIGYNSSEGWRITEIIGGTAPITITGDTVFTAATAMPEYAISFSTNYGTVTEEPIYAVAGESVQKLISGVEVTGTLPEGVTFEGWLYNGSPVTESTKMPTTNITLVAKFST